MAIMHARVQFCSSVHFPSSSSLLVLTAMGGHSASERRADCVQDWGNARAAKFFH